MYLFKDTVWHSKDLLYANYTLISGRKMNYLK